MKTLFYRNKYSWKWGTVRVGLASLVGYVLGALYGFEHIPNHGDEHAFLQELGGFLILTTLVGGTLAGLLEHRIYHRPR